MDAKIKLTGLWKNTSKGGETYYGGNLTPNARLLIFKNKFKKGEKDPDLIVYLASADRSGPKQKESAQAPTSQHADMF